jgi:hypothetical protein
MAHVHQQMHAMYAEMQQTLAAQAAAATATLQQSAAAAASHQAAAAQQPPQQPPHGIAIQLPKIRAPSAFNGQMGFVVDEWISELKQQFAYYGVRFPDDDAKVRFAIAYLTGAALRWWETQPPCHVWNEFVSRLHGRFRPVHAAMLARQKLGKLRQRQGQSVNQYVGVFQNMLTPITDMGAADQVHHFVWGLLGSIAPKVWEKHPETLVQAIDAAVSIEAMGNFGRAGAPGFHGSSSSSTSAGADMMDINNIQDDQEDINPEDPTIRAMRLQMIAMEGQLNAFRASSAPAPPASGIKPKNGNGKGGRYGKDRIDGLTPELIKSLQAAGKCFRCKEAGHMKNECPKKLKN